MDWPVLEVAARNMSWMSGNLFLAWSAVLFALHLRGTPRQARIAGRLLVGSLALVLLARLTVKQTMLDHPVGSVTALIIITALAALWSVRARAGGRIARVVGIIGVAAFSPNAPYILTDLFHSVQDARIVGLDAIQSLLLAIQYGWFLAAGTASWIVLIALGRAWLRERHPTWPARTSFIAVGGVMAFGIYLGRIERFHSWHPLQEPGRFLREVGAALTQPGPVAFTLVWWAVVVLVAAGGLAAWDRTDRTAGSAIQLTAGTAWALAGALIVSTPLINAAYRSVGLPNVTGPQATDILISVLAGVALSAFAGTRLAQVVRPGSRPPSPAGSGSRQATWAAAACVVIPLVGAGLVAASTAQWWTQFRGLCEYGPAVELHGDECGG